MNLQELIKAYDAVKGTFHDPELPAAVRKYMDDVRMRMAVPDDAHKIFKPGHWGDKTRAAELNDMFGRYAGVHPNDYHDPDAIDGTALENSISEYGNTGYRPINNIFRHPEGANMDLSYTDAARIMMDAMKPSANDMVLYRGLNGSGKTAAKIRSMDLRNELAEYGNKSFMSTSLSPRVASHFASTPAREANYRILVPKGTNMLPLGDAGKLTDELEYVLPPDSRYAKLPISGDSDWTDLILSRAGDLREPQYVPDSPGVGWLAGAAPLGVLGQYAAAANTPNQPSSNKGPR